MQEDGLQEGCQSLSVTNPRRDIHHFPELYLLEMSLWVQPTLKGRELERCEHQAGGIIGPHLRGCLLPTRTFVVKNELYPKRIWVNLCPSSISAEREPLNLGMS